MTDRAERLVVVPTFDVIRSHDHPGDRNHQAGRDLYNVIDWRGEWRGQVALTPQEAYDIHPIRPAAPPVQMEPAEPLKLLKRPSAFRVLVNGRYHFFGDEEEARDFAERAQGGDYEALFVRDGTPLNLTIEDVDDAADDLIDSVQYLQETLEAGEGVHESKWLGGVMRAHEMLIECSKRLALYAHPLPPEGGREWQATVSVDDLRRHIDDIRDEMNDLATMGVPPLWHSLLARLDDLLERCTTSPLPKAPEAT